MGGGASLHKTNSPLDHEFKVVKIEKKSLSRKGSKIGTKEAPKVGTSNGTNSASVPISQSMKLPKLEPLVQLLPEEKSKSARELRPIEKESWSELPYLTYKKPLSTDESAPPPLTKTASFYLCNQ